MKMAEEISQLAQISGLTAFIAVIIGFFFAFIILTKAIKNKQKLVFEFFLCVVFTLSPWFPSGLGYFYWLLTGELFRYEVYLLLGVLFIPIAIIAWLDVYLSNILPDRKKQILILYTLFSIAFEIYLIYFLFLAPSAPVETMLGIFDQKNNPTDIDYKGFIMIYLSVSILTSVLTGIHFSIISLKVEQSDVKVKGKFLLLAFLLFGVASIFDAVIEMDAFLLVIVRLMLMGATFFFYIGFVLPKWIKKLLNIKE